MSNGRDFSAFSGLFPRIYRSSVFCATLDAAMRTAFVAHEFVLTAPPDAQSAEVSTETWLAFLQYIQQRVARDIFSGNEMEAREYVSRDAVVHEARRLLAATRSPSLPTAETAYDAVNITSRRRAFGSIEDAMLSDDDDDDARRASHIVRFVYATLKASLSAEALAARQSHFLFDITRELGDDVEALAAAVSSTTGARVGVRVPRSMLLVAVCVASVSDESPVTGVSAL